jgi:hypothetical protein
VSGTDARQWSFDALGNVPGGWSDSARGAEGIDAYYARWFERAAAKRRSNPSAVLSRNATPSVFHQRHIGRVLRSSCNVGGRRLGSSRVENLVQADALLFGRVTYEMLEAAWRPPARTEARPDWMEPWMEPFARTIDAAKKYVVSSTLDRVHWNAELVRGDLGQGRSAAEAGVG